jgi:hypothetical protein
VVAGDDSGLIQVGVFFWTYAGINFLPGLWYQFSCHPSHLWLTQTTRSRHKILFTVTDTYLVLFRWHDCESLGCTFADSRRVVRWPHRLCAVWSIFQYKS